MQRVCVCALEGGGEEVGRISLYYSRSWISLYILKYASVNNLRLRLCKRTPKTADALVWYSEVGTPPPTPNTPLPNGNWQKTRNRSNIWGRAPHFIRRQSESRPSRLVSAWHYWRPRCVNVKRILSFHVYAFFTLFVPQHCQARPVHLT